MDDARGVTIASLLTSPLSIHSRGATAVVVVREECLDLARTLPCALVAGESPKRRGREQ